MSIFGNYARYYDLIYRDKNYAGEAEYVHSLIQRYFPDARSILELGCGTGRHAELLCDLGYDVCGVDSSDEMLESATNRIKKRSLDPDKNQELSFLHGDIRDFHLDKRFDVVIALFHVMSYITCNDDLRGAFRLIKEHLRPKGGLIFDCWYGPAVLTDIPKVRILKLEDESIEIMRTAEPTIHPNENVVEVNYNIYVRAKKSRETEVIKEAHEMRYLFSPELEMMLSESGMDIVAREQWETGKEAGFDTWSVCFIGKAQ